MKSVIFFVSALILSEITKRSPTPELNVAYWNFIPAFFIFILFAFGALSWGAWFRNKLTLKFEFETEKSLFDLSFGTVFLFFSTYILTYLGVFSVHYRILLWAYLSLGVFLGGSMVHLHHWFKDFEDSNRKWRSKILFCIPLLVVFLKILEALQFNQHGDSYLTYLPAPRVWAEDGNFHAWLKAPVFFMVTSWESLYAWGTALLGLEGGRGLDVSQVFSQWCVGGIGTFGLVLGLNAFCLQLSKKFPLSKTWYPIFIVLALQVPSIRWTANLAKHDFGVAFWGVAAAVLVLFDMNKNRRSAFCFGCIAGAAVIGKLTVFSMGLALGIFLLLNGPFLNALIYAGGVLLSVSPILVRNFLETTNPFFPWLNNVFKNNFMSMTLAPGANRAGTSAITFEGLKVYLAEFVIEIPISIILLLGFFLFRKQLKDYAKTVGVVFLATMVFILVFRPSTEIRYQNCNLMLMAASSGYFLFYFIESLKFKMNFDYKKSILVVLSIFFLATSNVTIFSIFQIGSKKFANLKERLPHLTGGDGKLWIRENLDPKKTILLVGDVHIFYIVDRQLTDVTQNIEWSRKLETMETPVFEEELRHADNDILYMANDMQYWASKSSTKQLMADSVKNWNIKCLLYQSSQAQIWDLPCLKTVM